MKMAENSRNSTKIQTLSLKSPNSSMPSSSSVGTLENQTEAADRGHVGKPLEKEGGGEAGGRIGSVKAPEIQGDGGGKEAETNRDGGEKEAETEGDGADEGDEEEGECGFCLFMKGGGCRESFIAWEKCVEEAEKNKEDMVDKCFEITGMLKKCMDAHADYYAPVLQAEKVMEEEAAKELERGSAVQEAENSADTEAVKDSERDRVVHDSVETAEKEAVEVLERGGSEQNASRES